MLPVDYKSVCYIFVSVHMVRLEILLLVKIVDSATFASAEVCT